MTSRSATHSQKGGAEPSVELRALRALATYRGVLVVLTILILLFSSTLAGFRTVGNVSNIVETNAVLLIVSIGLTFPMIAGGFDLSVAGIEMLSGIVLIRLVSSGLPLWSAITIVLIGALLFGAVINGVLIGYFRVNFFIVTLGTLTILQGISFQLTGGSSLGMYHEPFVRYIGSGQIGAVPVAGIIAAVVAVLAIATMRYTGLGRMIYAIGGNNEAAHLAGIPVRRVTMLTYALSAGLAGMAGVINVGRLESASATTDATIVLTAAAAVLIGGVAFGGGTGTILGTLFGVMFLGVLQSGLLIAGVTSYVEDIVTGMVLIGSVSVDRLRGAEGFLARRGWWRGPVSDVAEADDSNEGRLLEGESNGENVGAVTRGPVDVDVSSAPEATSE